MFKKLKNKFKYDMITFLRLPFTLVGMLNTIIGCLVAPIVLAFLLYGIPKDMYGWEYPWWVGIVIWFVIISPVVGLLGNPKTQRIGMFVESIFTGAALAFFTDGKFMQPILDRYFSVDFWTIKGFALSTLFLGSLIFVICIINIKLTFKYGTEEDIYDLGDDVVEKWAYDEDKRHEASTKKFWEEEAKYAAEQQAKAEAAAKAKQERIATMTVTNLPPDEEIKI